MTERSAAHATFVIERTYDDVPPARVFAAWASIEAKSRWFIGPEGWTEIERTQDFRVGGSERLRGRWAGGTVSTFDAHYEDIVPDQRIVYAYSMHIDDRRISVSLATIEIKPSGRGTRLVLTEQGVFLDGYDDNGSRERGTNVLLDQFGAALKRAAA